MAERKHTDTRVRLHLLPFEEAVKRLLRVPPPPKEERRRATERPAKPTRREKKEADES
jgi:hypothetical protein